MKNQLLLTSLLLILLGACHNDVDSPSLLYKRWHLARTRHLQDATWYTYHSEVYYDVEYRPDGTLIHRRDGQVATLCCNASRFSQKGSTIDYDEFLYCPNASCVSRPNAVIIVLSEDSLILLANNRLEQYEPAN
ncbi:hypothetical protein [Spirosoma sp.]|uniref:hypothetical protein n=1 Tax=Spirosoma sp. TaxID=1899569 RepID=UPI003B3B5F37